MRYESLAYALLATASPMIGSDVGGSLVTVVTLGATVFDNPTSLEISVVTNRLIARTSGVNLLEITPGI